MLRKLTIGKVNISRNIATQSKIKQGKLKSVIGLEVHAQIASESKLFSGSSAAFSSPLNSAVSYFDASVPGTLPVLNKKCVEAGIKTALSLSCCVNEFSMFDRKHYFYADLPNGYQITQQRAALANNGQISFPVIVPGKNVYHKTVRLLQLQLEQDSGKSLHDDILKRSLVDLNRAGVPLMELVFAPDLETGEEAASLVKELIIILKRLGTCSCKMEEGALRVDANISIHQEGDPLGVRTEVKNIGSVRSISQACSFEIQRQMDILLQGDIIRNETRSWDADRRCTIAMRDKEVLQDYRFMPEPNLPPLRLCIGEIKDNDEISIDHIARTLPDLPETTRRHLIETYALKEVTAIILVNEPCLLEHFFYIVKNISDTPSKLIANFLINDLLTYCNKTNINIEECQLTGEHLKDIVQSLHKDEINLQAARTLIEIIEKCPASSVKKVISEYNLKQITDPEIIEDLCWRAMKNHEGAVRQYKKGKTKALYALLGEVAKLSDQKANMRDVTIRLEELLKAK